MKRKLLSIGEVSRLAGVHIKSLRYYDRIGVLKPAYVDPDTGYRYYTYKQLGILDAIVTCIELDLPLKEFGRFLTEDGNTIHYDDLLTEGKTKANEKIKMIKDGIKNIEYLQKEIERSQVIQAGTEPVIMDIPLNKYYIKPFKGIINDEDYYEGFLEIFNEATESGHKPGFEIGKLFIFNKDNIKKYDYVELISAAPGKQKNIITIKEKHCLTKCVNTSKIENAEEEFKDIFAMGSEVTVIETEMITRDYNVSEPMYELSCILPD